MPLLYSHYMKKKTFYLSISLLFCGCGTYDQMGIPTGEYYDGIKQEYRHHEWTDFELSHHRQLRAIRTKEHVIVHNTNDNGHTLAVLTENYNLVANQDSLICVYLPNSEVSIFHSNAPNIDGMEFNYYECILRYLTQNVAVAEAYSPLLESMSGVKLNHQDTIQADKDGKTLVTATIQRKICTPYGCYIGEIPLDLIFGNKKNGTLHAVEYLPEHKKDIFTVRNVQHRDMSAMLNDLANISKYSNNGYTLNWDDNVPPSHLTSTYAPDTLEQEHLVYPFINSITYDTLRLEDVDGWILVLPWVDVRTLKRNNRLAKQLGDLCTVILANVENNGKSQTEQMESSLRERSHCYHAQDYGLLFSKNDIILVSPDRTIRLRHSIDTEIDYHEVSHLILLEK